MDKDEWFETWFDTRYYHILYRNRDETEARQFIDALLRFLSPPPGSRFLDVACGRGRHAINLHEYGFRVTGIDLSENSIAEANKYNSNTLDFFVWDIRQPLPVSGFDYALNLFTSFGYFDTLEEHIQTIRNICQSMNPGGYFVLDYFNTAYLKSNLVKEETCERSGICFNISRSFRSGFIFKDILVNEGDTTHPYTERVMAFDRNDLYKILTEGGFDPIHCFGNYNLDPFSHDQPRVIIIAQKNP